MVILAVRRQALRLVLMATVGVTALFIACAPLPANTEPTVQASSTAPPSPGAPTALSTEADTVALVLPSLVQVVTPSGKGSGVKLASGVLTNAHVVAGADRVEVLTRDGQRFGAFVSRRDPKRDLALLLTEAAIPPLELEPARDQRQGDTLLVLGHPRSDVVGLEPTLTRGSVSALREDPDNDRLLLQTDAALNPGNSGGPIVNLRGRLVAIVSFGVKDSEGLGFGVSTESIRAFLEEQRSPVPQVTTAPAARPKAVPQGLDVDARRIVLTLADLGHGWGLITGVSEKINVKAKDFATGHFSWRADSDFSPDSLSTVRAYVRVRENPIWSLEDLEDEDDIPEGFHRVAAPALGDGSAAWVSEDGAIVKVALANVSVDARAWGQDKRVSVRKAAGLAQVMLGRVITEEVQSTATAIAPPIRATATAFALSQPVREWPTEVVPPTPTPRPTTVPRRCDSAEGIVTRNVEARGEIIVSAHYTVTGFVRNTCNYARRAQLEITLLDGQRVITTMVTASLSLRAGEEQAFQEGLIFSANLVQGVRNGTVRVVPRFLD